MFCVLEKIFVIILAVSDNSGKNLLATLLSNTKKKKSRMAWPKFLAFAKFVVKICFVSCKSNACVVEVNEKSQFRSKI